MMKRRNFLATAAAASAGGFVRAEPDGAKPPNLLIVHCDELNFRTLGCYRDTLPDEQAFMWGKKAVVETPHIDSLAKEGMLWTKCYAATPVCSPSRSTFLTGKHCFHTPVIQNDIPMGDEHETFASLLSKAGYATGYAGKWHLDGEAKPGWAPPRKFGFQDNRYMFNRGHWKVLEDTPAGPRVKSRNNRGEPTPKVKGADETSFTTDWLMQKCMSYITEHKNAPFCYMLSIPDPHGPDTVRAPYDTMFPKGVTQKPRTYDKKGDIPSWAAKVKNCPWEMSQYLGMMKCIDDNMGKLITHLKELGIYDQTIVIFTADHGDLRGEHSRQNKGVPMEASAKIPFVIRYPKSIPANKVVNEVTTTVDFLPTILSFMNVPATKNEGRDLSPLLKGQNLPNEFQDIAYFRAPGTAARWLGVVTPRYKLLLSKDNDPWLLDLEDDPDELVNFINHPEKAKVREELATQLQNFAKESGDPYFKIEKIQNDLNALTNPV